MTPLASVEDSLRRRKQYALAGNKWSAGRGTAPLQAQCYFLNSKIEVNGYDVCITKIMKSGCMVTSTTKANSRCAVPSSVNLI